MVLQVRKVRDAAGMAVTEAYQGCPTSPRGRYDDGLEERDGATAECPTTPRGRNADNWLTDKQVRWIRELCADGATYEEVGAAYGISYATARQLATGRDRRSAGGPFTGPRRKPKRQPPTESQWANVIAMRRQGVTWEEIAECMPGYTADSLRQTWRRRLRKEDG